MCMNEMFVYLFLYHMNLDDNDDTYMFFFSFIYLGYKDDAYAHHLFVSIVGTEQDSGTIWPLSLYLYPQVRPSKVAYGHHIYFT